MKKMVNTVLVSAAAALAFPFVSLAEDGYIESDGTTFINLGHCVGPKTKIELDFQMVEVVNGESAIYATDNAYWAFYVNGDYCQYGVDSQPVNDQDAFSIRYEAASF